MKSPVQPGFNTYGYALQNPVMYADFTGLDPGDIFSTVHEAAEDAANFSLTTRGIGYPSQVRQVRFGDCPGYTYSWIFEMPKNYPDDWPDFPEQNDNSGEPPSNSDGLPVDMSRYNTPIHQAIVNGNTAVKIYSECGGSIGKTSKCIINFGAQIGIQKINTGNKRISDATNR
ncbi:MAG TPA: hypothetical protein PK031_07300 [Pseudomonadales bacterium]|nr:hypothetical protein [Pseudomonadales bacterium]